jgi:hypothetical protein
MSAAMEGMSCARAKRSAIAGGLFGGAAKP